MKLCFNEKLKIAEEKQNITGTECKKRQGDGGDPPQATQEYLFA